jgi:hypothetical protein
MALYYCPFTNVWSHAFTTGSLPPAESSSVISSMTADSNITVVPPSTRTPSATVSSPTAGFTPSAIKSSCPTAKSAGGRAIDRENVERLVWEYYNSQVGDSKSEGAPRDTPWTQQSLDEHYDSVSQKSPLIQ